MACVVIDGREMTFELSLWQRTSKADKPYMSGEIQEPWVKPQNDAPQDARSAPITRYPGPPSAEELAAMPEQENDELPF